VQRHKSIKNKKSILIIVILLLSLSIVLYLLANRYLIEHVEKDNAFYEYIDSGTVTSEKQTTEDTNSQETMESDADKVEIYVNDDWNYNDDFISVNINKISEGPGSDTITYYVADVVLKNSESLKTAFAKNQFGANIVQDTSVIAEDNNAIFAINGDYYGFREDGIVIRNGVIFRDDPTRKGLAIYDDGSMKSYDETTANAEELIASGVIQAFTFGPVLVENGTANSDFGKTVIDTNFGNRSIQNANPRTGVGIISDNHFIFVVVDGRSRGYSKGMTLTEFAKVFEDLGCTDAYNLDGGGSSTMYFCGRVVNNPLGKEEERGVSDIIYIN